MNLVKSYPNLTVIFACFFWGTYWIPLRYIDSSGENSVWPLCLSFILLSAILFKPLLQSAKILLFEKNFFFILGCFFSGLGITLYSESLLRGEIAKVVVLFYLCPIWGTIFARIILKHKFNFGRVLSIILGLIGLEIIVGIDKGIIIPETIAEWIAIFAGITWALSTVFFHVAKSTNSYQKTSLTSFFIFIIFLILCFFPDGRSITITSNLFSSSLIYIWVILFCLIWLLPSILLTFFSIEILDPGRINILLAFEVVIGFLSAFLLTNEIIEISHILGAIFVISACFVDVFYNKIRKKL